MNIKIKFLGAAKSVTGSKYLLQVDDKKILVDCGMFQGQKELRLRNWDKLPVDPRQIDIVVITHAHIDHTGYLPRLVKDGFSGKIICTAATEDLMSIMLLDAAKLQEEEALFAAKKGFSKHEDPKPLFNTDDVKLVMQLVESHSFKSEFNLLPNVSVTFHIAGHILGAAIVELKVSGKSQQKKIIFSGDLGRYNDPIMFDPEAIAEADILLTESTYGDRLNPMTNVTEQLATIVNETYANEGTLVIPAFAVGRTQSLIYYFHQLIEAKKIPMLPVFVDSPMAISVTNLYEKHAGLHKIKVTESRHELISIFDTPNIHFCNTSESSKALNSMKKPGIIISASGMATGGRVLHHLYHRLRNENDTLLFAGYQAEGSRGRSILEGDKFVKIFGEDVPVRCHVREVHGLSAHADQSELLRWLSNFKKAPKTTFIVHGEEASSIVFSNVIQQKLGWNTLIPEYLQSVELFSGI
ncbi:MAG: MBL fold metallo-hydrolase [Bacteroidetes bacterium]|nr:MBL fold metallo-hydrolase [Bacteroidota bacterium]MBI3482344.1 MBL fold metallo-hydrolase [Bacteroidota bacterium]